MININLKNFSISNNSPFILIAGPCVIENESHSLMIAEDLHKICDDVGINLIFKSSFDKANRSSINSDRGINLDDALKIFRHSSFINYKRVISSCFKFSFYIFKYRVAKVINCINFSVHDFFAFNDFTSKCLTNSLMS